MELKRRKMSIILNVILIAMEIIGVVLAIREVGFFDIRYYTQDSNLFALIVSVLYLACLCSTREMPRVASVLKYMSVLSLTVTFLVVVFVLSPMFGFDYVKMMFTGSFIFFHTLCPIIAFISFVYFEDNIVGGLKDNFRAMYFTIAYATITIILNILGILEGPYPFLMVRVNSIYISIFWAIVIIGGGFLLAKLLEVLKLKKH